LLELISVYDILKIAVQSERWHLYNIHGVDLTLVTAGLEILIAEIPYVDDVQYQADELKRIATHNFDHIR
jgi:hypothetical protein